MAMPSYLDAKIWLSDSACAVVGPVTPGIFAAHCTRFFDGLLITLELLVLSTGLGLVLALALALARTASRPWLWAPAYGYIYVFRGTPLLVQLWVFYYGLGSLGAEGLGVLWPLFRDAWRIGLLVLTLNTAAYTAEILRGGIMNVPRGHCEAAQTLGLRWWPTMRLVVLPQAMRMAWPAYGNEVILVLKGSALVSTITVLDLMGQTRTVFTRSYRLDIFLYAAVLYLLLSGAITLGMKALERRQARRIPLEGEEVP